MRPNSVTRHLEKAVPKPTFGIALDLHGRALCCELEMSTVGRGKRLWRLFPWVTIPAVLIACKPTLDDLTVWKAQLSSPGGHWIASARTIQNGGFGSGDIDTIVYLHRKGDARAPQEILEFDGGAVAHSYVLDNAANRGGGISLTMHWATPTHLVVTYQSHPTIDFQVVKLQDVVITTLRLPAGADSVGAAP